MKALRLACVQAGVLSLVLFSAVAVGQQESGVLTGWISFWDAFDSGIEGGGVVFYDLPNAEYQVMVQNLEPDTSYFVYIVEHRPPTSPAGNPQDWSAWGGPVTTAGGGEDSMYFKLGEIRTNFRGDGVLSVSLGAESSELVRRFNMIGIFEGARASGQPWNTAVLACNGEFYGVGERPHDVQMKQEGM